MTDDSRRSAPRITIIVPCRNEVRHIEACLRSVLSFEEPPGGFEVVVADGMSDDGTREVLARLASADPRVRFVDNPARITPCALNAAIQAARGEIIVRIDAHARFAPDYLRLCVQTLTRTGAQNVGGPTIAEGKTYMQQAIAAAYGSAFAVGGSRFHDATFEGYADTVPFGCWPRPVLEKLGLFDEELVRNQDDELNVRILRSGGKIWLNPRIRSWYSPRASLSHLFKQYWQYGYWKIRVMQKHRLVLKARHVGPGLFAALLFLLSALAPFLWMARAMLALQVVSYTLALLLASAIASGRHGWRLFPVLPAVFTAYHLGYGFGSLAGVWDFLIRGRKSGRYVELTRK